MSEKKEMKLPDQTEGISRREILLGMGAAAAMAYTGSASAAMKEHDHSKHATQNTTLMDAVNNCNDKGRKCVAHCMVSFVEGDTELAKCASKVQEMLAVCGGFSYLVASNSSYVKGYAKVCEQVCRDCAKECREHEEHVECRNCAEACDDIIDAIKLSV